MSKTDFTAKNSRISVEVERLGFSVIPSVIDTDTTGCLIHALDEVLQSSSDERSGYALRNVAQMVPEVRRLAESAVTRDIVESVLGKGAFLVRSLFFDKTPGANWKVAWHQDLTIAVKEKSEVAEFGPWSTKDGVAHVQPPASVLERMITLRVHLDPCDETNGPLQVLAGSHRSGKLSAEQIAVWRQNITATICVVPVGGAVVMRPLILHASSPSQAPTHRRVIHLEFAAAPLPGGLAWLD